VSEVAFQRWVLRGGFAVAALYVVVALIVLILADHSADAIPYAYTAVSIAGPLVVVSRLLRSERHGGTGGPGTGDDTGPGPSDGGEPKPPPWWPEFEAEFWSHVDSKAAQPRAVTRELRGDRRARIVEVS
jgi:hypothetical protein